MSQIIKILIFIFVKALVINAAFSSKNQDSPIYLGPLELTEESEHVVNLTRLLLSKLELSIDSTIKLDSIHFDNNPAFADQQDYFNLELKKTRYNTLSSNKQHTHSIILLKTSHSKKKFDLEYMCRVASFCSCVDCKVSLNFIVRLENNRSMKK